MMNDGMWIEFEAFKAFIRFYKVNRYHSFKHLSDLSWDPNLSIYFYTNSFIIIMTRDTKGKFGNE